ncbi:patatin-like protein [Nocardioides sp. YIM 152315]|uniref:patatin-like protein n=1 Tax=Nocardioides sp. YIM 152315 TaxID=3031760 RepID=UPI0023DC1C5B|nr:patatin-like protein [Nocardioides sp. YIM 152315]MDF1604205.1 patatin-like protein [Nocardioides sp. YIM 152315]
MAGPQAPREELRLAVVLNGGVSLAVWIGGVALEIDRLTRGDRVYGELLRMLDMSARADVITGTSAGGINGAALALAQVNDHADLRGLRDLWAAQGRMETLLRTPFQGQPASLLRGDEYFLPSLERALRGLAVDYAPIGPDRRPIHLGVTTTLLDGARTVTSDALGQALPQELHAGLLTFKHLENDGQDDFAEDQIGETVRRLALAARSSASFPVAFEPSFLPVGTAVSGNGRPDMTMVADWVDPTGPVDQSHFAVDGGAMVNTPTLPALEVIDSLPASTSVRRVMLLVFPHAPSVRERPAADEHDPPTVVEALTGLAHATRSEAGRTHVEKVEEHNRRAAARRFGRADVLISLQRSTNNGLAEMLGGLFGTLYPHYRELRLRRAARDLAERVPARRGWSYDRVLTAVEQAQARVDARDGLPYVVATAAADSWRFDPDRGWPWGVTTAEHLADDALDLARRLVRLDCTAEERLLVEQERMALFAVRRGVEDARRRFDDVWFQGILSGLPPKASYWQVRLDAQQRAYLGGRTLEATDFAELTSEPERRVRLADAVNETYPERKLGDAVGASLVALATSLRELTATVTRLAAAATGDDQLALLAWQRLLTEAPDEEALITELVRLDVVTTCLSNAPERGSEQLVELVQVSLQTANVFAQVTTQGTDKLGGARLGRFAGFLKESWRINDWIWGRLDAATMLCRVLLQPERMRRARAEAERRGEPWPATAEQWVDEWVARLFEGRDPGPGFLSVRERAVAEMHRCVYTDTADLPPTLDAVAGLFAWAIQADVAAEDLPALRDAIAADRREGATQASYGARFVEDNAALLDRLKGLGPVPLASNDPSLPESVDPRSAERRGLGLDGLRAFDRAGVGREPLDAEASGDLLIRTGVTAVAVGATVLDSPKLGVPAAKPLTRTIRGVALLPYWVARGLTGGARIGNTVAIAVLALGAAMLALSLVLSETPRWVALIGVSAVLFGFAYAALRTGSLLHGIVLLAPVVPLVAYAVTQQVRPAETSLPTLAVLPFVAALIAGLVVLGSLPALVRTPFAVVDGWVGRRTLIALIVAAGVLEVATVVVIALLVSWRPAAVVLLVAVVVDAATWLAQRESSAFRVRFQAVGGWVEDRLVHPQAVAGAWACVYALLTAAAGVVLWLLVRGLDDDLRFGSGEHRGDLTATGVALWASVIGALVMTVLLAVLVLALPRRARSRFADELERQARLGVLPVGASLDETRDLLVRRLRTRGTAYVYLTEVVGAELVLSDIGDRLAQRLWHAGAS